MTRKLKPMPDTVGLMLPTWRKAATKKTKMKGVCRWFLLCTRPATTEVEHTVLGMVPCCEKCAAFARGAK
jgi:hypothetical protein